MSAPDTNIDKQVRRHRGPLFGIAIATAFAGILFALLTGWTAYNGESPADDDTPVMTVDQ